MDQWLSNARDEVARTAGLSAGDLDLSEEEETTLLDLARVAARESGARTNAPLLCYLVGRASRDADLRRLADAVRTETSG